MQQCYQQAEKVYERPALQLEQVSFLRFLFSLLNGKTVDAIHVIKLVVPSSVHRSAHTCDDGESDLIGDLKTQIKEKENVFFDMEAYLPKRNG